MCNWWSNGHWCVIGEVMGTDVMYNWWSNGHWCVIGEKMGTDV